MRRFAWFLAAACLAVVALFALVVALLPRETLKTRIGEQISAWTGREVSLRGEPELDFFPELSVTLKDVRVSGPDGMADAEIISMDRLKGTIRLLPLIIGEVEIESYTMVRPRLRLVVGEDGARNWAFDSGAAALQLAFAGDVPLGEFRLEDGTVLYEDRQDGTAERLDSLNLTVAWPSVRNPVVVDGSAIWRGEQVAFSSRAAQPFEFLGGEASAFEARLDSAPMTMEFAGEATDPNSPQLAGTLTMASPSLRGFVAWLGGDIGPGSTFGEARLSGNAVLREQVLSVENAQLALDGNTATGALAVALSAVPEITGTLAFPRLDLTPYLAGFATAFASGQDWRGIGLGTGWFGGLQTDIRLSAGSVEVGNLRLGDAAATVSLRGARLEIGVAQAKLAGGGLTGALTIADIAESPDALVGAQLRAGDLAIAQVAQVVGVPAGVTGTASVRTDLTSRGATLGALFDGLGGIARLDVENGTFPLLGIAEIAVGGAGANPPATGIAPATPVKGLTVGFSFAKGLAILERASVSALAFTADATGWIVLKDGTLGLNGTVRPGALGAPPSLEMPFTIGGTLVKPVARPLAAASN